MEFVPLIAVGVSSFVAIGIAAWNRGKSSDDHVWEAIEKLNDNKVNRDDCRSFKTRIGSESDEHREHISEVKEDISEIKEGIAFLKGKME